MHTFTLVRAANSNAYSITQEIFRSVQLPSAGPQPAAPAAAAPGFHGSAQPQQAAQQPRPGSWPQAKTPLTAEQLAERDSRSIYVGNVRRRPRQAS